MVDFGWLGFRGQAEMESEDLLPLDVKNPARQPLFAFAKKFFSRMPVVQAAAFVKTHNKNHTNQPTDTNPSIKFNH